MTESSTPERALGCLLLLISIPISVSIRGYVLVKLWAWFIVTHFGVAPLSVATALGIALIAGFLTYQDIDVESPKRSYGETIIRGIVGRVIGPLVTLLFGWLVLRFW